MIFRKPRRIWQKSTSPEHLIDKDPTEMYEKLQRIKGQRVDPCVSDVFHAAVAQARDPKLPKEKCEWWYWSKIRKQGK